MMMKLISVLMTLALIVPASTWAESKPKKKKKRPGIFKRMDKNFDKSVSRNEYMSFHTDRLYNQFDELDKNGDGKISRKEWGQMIKKRQAWIKKNREKKKK